MSLRRSILSSLETNFKRINGTTDSTAGPLRSPYTYKNNVFSNVVRRFKFFDEINDFPSIVMAVVNENRTYIGAGISYGTLFVNARGYIRDGDDSIAAAEDLLDDMEFVIESMNYDSSLCSFNLEDIRILFLETDEGLFSPYGLAQMLIQINYQL